MNLTESVKVPVEIGIIFLTLFGVYRFLRGTGGAGVLKGMVIVFTVFVLSAFALANVLELYRINFILKNFLTYIFLAVIIVFQPELRRGLIVLSQRPLWRSFFDTGTERTINLLVTAVTRLAAQKTGALIVLEKGVGLGAYAETGTPLDAQLSELLLEAVFFTNAPLHDGGVIVRHDRVVAAGCMFPLTANPNVSRRLGMRHRAALGISEESDSLAIVVSEETGLISGAQAGLLTRALGRDGLIHVLERFYRERAELTAEAAPALASE